MTTPTSTEPAPMPHPNDDPDFAAARQAPVDYAAALAEVRGNPRISDLGKAEKATAAYSEYTAALGGAWERLQARRQARYDWLAAQVPTGPSVPDDASPADRAALLGAFRTHYARAVEADRDGRARMLDEADRFGDEPARRAAVAAILEHSERDTLRNRPDRYSTLTAHLDELTDLQRGGSATVRGFQRQAWRQQPEPPEVKQLPELQAAAEKRTEAWRRAGHLR
jgi:hypothetical protein